MVSETLILHAPNPLFFLLSSHRHLDDLGASKFMMGWTVAVGMLTSLPFLIFSGPITDMVGHINVIVIGMMAYFCRLVGYSFLQVKKIQKVFVFLITRVSLF